MSESLAQFCADPKHPTLCSSATLFALAFVCIQPERPYGLSFVNRSKGSLAPLALRSQCGSTAKDLIVLAHVTIDRDNTLPVKKLSSYYSS